MLSSNVAKIVVSYCWDEKQVLGFLWEGGGDGDRDGGCCIRKYDESRFVFNVEELRMMKGMGISLECVSVGGLHRWDDLDGILDDCVHLIVERGTLRRIVVPIWVRTLELFGCEFLVDVEASGLCSLRVRECRMIDLDLGLGGLKSVEIVRTGIVGKICLGDVSGMVDFRVSGLSGKEEWLYSVLGLMSNELKRVEVRECGNLDFSGLGRLYSLRRIGLQGCDMGGEDGSVVDLSGLYSLRSVEIVHCFLGGGNEAKRVILPRGLMNLDLSYCHLDSFDLFDGLSDLRRLKVLEANVSDLSVVSRLRKLMVFEYCYEHDYSGIEVDVSCLKSCVNLRKLLLDGVRVVGDLGASVSKSMRNVFVMGGNWVGVGGDRDRDNLRRLKFYNNANLDFLLLYRNLVEIQIYDGRNLTSIDGVEMCRLLRVFEINGGKMKRFDSLRNCEEIVIKNCVIEGFGADVKCRKLKLTACKMGYGSLGGLHRLNLLGFNKCDFAVVPDLGEGSVGLEEIELHYCDNLVDIGSLGNFKKLRKIDLWGCSSICNLDVLGGLEYVESLSIISCYKVASIDGLAGWRRIRNLVLSNCLVENLSVVGNFVMLKTIYINLCPFVRSVEALGRCVNLESVKLSHCSALSRLNVHDRLFCVKINDVKRLEQWFEENRAFWCCVNLDNWRNYLRV